MAVAFSENNLLALADLMFYSSVPLIDNIAFAILCSAALQLLNRLLYREKYSLSFSLSLFCLRGYSEKASGEKQQTKTNFVTRTILSKSS